MIRSVRSSSVAVLALLFLVPTQSHSEEPPPSSAPVQEPPVQSGPVQDPRLGDSKEGEESVVRVSGASLSLFGVVPSVMR